MERLFGEDMCRTNNAQELKATNRIPTRNFIIAWAPGRQKYGQLQFEKESLAVRVLAGGIDWLIAIEIGIWGKGKMKM